MKRALSVIFSAMTGVVLLSACQDDDEQIVKPANTPGTADVHFVFRRGIEVPYEGETATVSVLMRKNNYNVDPVEETILLDSTFTIDLADMPSEISFTKHVSFESLEQQGLWIAQGYLLKSVGYSEMHGQYWSREPNESDQVYATVNIRR